MERTARGDFEAPISGQASAHRTEARKRMESILVALSDEAIDGRLLVRTTTRGK
jgi:hypothetical protein